MGFDQARQYCEVGQYCIRRATVRLQQLRIGRLTSGAHEADRVGIEDKIGISEYDVRRAVEKTPDAQPDRPLSRFERQASEQFGANVRLSLNHRRHQRVQ